MLIYLQHPVRSDIFFDVLILNKKYCITLDDLQIRAYSWINQYKKQFRLNKGRWYDGPRIFRAKKLYFVYNIQSIIQ